MHVYVKYSSKLSAVFECIESIEKDQDYSVSYKNIMQMYKYRNSTSYCATELVKLNKVNAKCELVLTLYQNLFIETYGLTCPPEHGVVEERELHLSVMLQRGPTSRCRHVDVRHVEGNLNRQEGLSRVPNLEKQWHS